jgi:hypothetical protein
MIRVCLIVFLLLGAAVHGGSQTREPKKEAPLRLVLSEVKPGTMSSEQYCMLVFDDHRFHSEKAILSHGGDRERKVYEGDFSDADWSALQGILQDDGLRKLEVKRAFTPLAMQGVHSYTISIKRESEFQNMEFMDDSSRKPYEAQLKPLLQWWKSTRGRRMSVSEAPPDSHCALDSSHGVFSY